MSGVKTCGVDDYRNELFEKFKTSALFALLSEAMGRIENPAEFREVLIKTWAGKMADEYQEAMTTASELVSDTPVEDLPLHLTPDGMKDQEQFFNSMVEVMTSDIRAMLNNPKEGGA